MLRRGQPAFNARMQLLSPERAPTYTDDAEWSPVPEELSCDNTPILARTQELETPIRMVETSEKLGDEDTSVQGATLSPAQRIRLDMDSKREQHILGQFESLPFWSDTAGR
eukprot:TRINITY_DN16594_c0_g1_i1.p1 TRINITY_DN16594_c0_g1~~TRINITY_DN16594_c0_g1_i1.p1  ORF type:complete len:111 (-),score=15.77 TRINITY_DN16594_c0_g1_i1:261-593(-)